MTDDHPDKTGDTGTDLAYDLAHETGAITAPPVPHTWEEPPHVVTATPEYDGDYSYDLAHDVPR